MEKKVWCKTPVVRRRNRYGTGARSIRRATIRGARHTSTQAGCIADVVRKIDGTLMTGRQGSTRRLTHLRRNRRGLVDFTSSVLGGHTSTSRNLPGRDTIRRTVKWDLRATVYKHISRMKVALLVLISTYVRDKQILGSEIINLCRIPTGYKRYRFLRPGITGLVQQPAAR